ncbi:MAG: hypothetical protein DRN81_02060 [Thermoproteota archaeon]|nr:MAG: hypothetical protein DRN81_02060 [Candidatus Korarchaeota archaeon]
MHLKVLSIFLFSILLLVPLTAIAEPYNISSSDANRFFVKGTQAPYDPKISCSDNYPNRCVMLIYNEGGFGNKVQAWYSTDGFETSLDSCVAPQCVEIGSYSIDLSGIASNQSLLPYFHLPYDVVWDSGKIATDAFFIVIGEKTYRYLPGVDNSGFPFYTPSWNDVVIDDITDRFSNTACISTDQRCLIHCWGLSFDNNDPQSLFVGCAYAYNPGPPGFCTVGSNCPGLMRTVLAEYNISSKNYGTLTAIGSESPDDTDCVCALDTSVGGGNNCPSSLVVDYLKGVAIANGGYYGYNVTMSGTGIFSQDIGASCGDIDSAPSSIAGVSNVTFPTGDAQHHQLGSDLYWLNASQGIFKAQISGFFAGFGTSEAVRTFDNGEVANESDSASVSGGGTAKDYIVWSYYNETVSGDEGIYVYRQSLIPVQVNMPSGINIQGSLACTTDEGENYTDFDSSSTGFLELSTPCTSNNQITLTTSESLPGDFTYTFDATGCESSGFIISAFYSEDVPIDFEFQVNEDPVFGNGQALQDVEITLSGYGTENTSSSGSATFELNPILGANFSVSENTCSADFLLDGTPRTYTFIADKSGYISEIGTITPATKIAVGSWLFEDRLAITLEETGTFIEVNLELPGGIPFTPCNSPDVTYQGSVSGVTESWVIENGIQIASTTFTEFPAFLKVNNSGSSYDVNITITYGNESISQNITVTPDDSFEINIVIPKAITQTPCTQQCDCVDSQCIGQYHYESSGCTDGFCNYTVTDCLSDTLCDDSGGCFNIDTGVACVTPGSRTGCDSGCVNDDILEYGVCGSGLTCLNKTKTCVSGCNATAGVCEEERLCIIPVAQKFQVGSDSFFVTCDQSNAGTTFCGASHLIDDNLTGFQVLKSQAMTTWGNVNNIPVTPDGWNYIETTNANGDEIYLFLTPRITCSSSCEMSVEFCGANGCDSETGECIGVGSGVDPMATLFAGWGLAVTAFINTVFPNIYAKSIFSLIVIFITSIGMLLIGRGQKDIALYVLGMDVIIAMIFTFVGFLPFYVAIIMAIVAGFLVFKGLFQGG